MPKKLRESAEAGAVPGHFIAAGGGPINQTTAERMHRRSDSREDLTAAAFHPAVFSPIDEWCVCPTVFGLQLVQSGFAARNTAVGITNYELRMARYAVK